MKKFIAGLAAMVLFVGCETRQISNPYPEYRCKQIGWIKREGAISDRLYVTYYHDVCVLGPEIPETPPKFIKLEE